MINQNKIDGLVREHGNREGHIHDGFRFARAVERLVIHETYKETDRLNAEVKGLENLLEKAREQVRDMHETNLQLVGQLTQSSQSQVSDASLMDILIDITHHEGAIEEFRPRWEPIVKAELKRRLQSISAPADIPAQPAKDSEK